MFAERQAIPGPSALAAGADLSDQGFTILRGAASSMVIARVAADLAPHFEATPFCQGGFYGARTKRFGRLLARSPAVAELVMDTAPLALAYRALRPWCDTLQLNLTQAIEIHPGAPAQFPHRDQDMWGGVTGEVEYLVNVIWPLTPFPSGSGAERRTHVLVKPFSSGLATNLIITTDRRSYHLSLTSTHGAAMASLSWTYPQDALIALRRTAADAEAAAPVGRELAVEQLHFDYAISGDKPAWRPLRAFDDGRQTFIEFPESLAVGEAPPLFVIGDDGEAQLVNYRVQGRFYVVDRLFDRAELRLGTKKQKVVRIVRGTARGRRS